MSEYRPWRPVTVIENKHRPATHLQIREADCAALQAVSKGLANEDQQKMAMAAIMHICAINDLEYLPAEHGGERDSSFKSGMRHVGLQLRKLTSHPLSLLVGEDDEQREPHRRTGKPGDDRNADRARR